MRVPTNLRKRGRNWYGTYRDASGKRRERCLGPDLREAIRLLAEIGRNARRARVGLDDEIGQGQRVDVLLDAWLSWLRSRRGPKYCRDVETACRSMLAGIAEVKDMTAGAIEDARDRLPGSARTKNKRAAWVLSFARWLRRTGRARPPAEEIVPVAPRPTRVRRVLDADERRRLQAAADAGPVGTLVAILMGSGLRLGEALRLRWDDFDGDALFVRTSKNGDSRKVPIEADLADRLSRLRLTRRFSSAIVTSPRGLSMTSVGAGQRLLWWLRDAIQASGIDPRGIDFHSFRHTRATEMAARGASIPQLMALFGWRSVAMAARYVHSEGVPVSDLVQGVRQGCGKPDTGGGTRTHKSVKLSGF